MKRTISSVAILVSACSALSAQGLDFVKWLDYPAPGIPRTADGKADLAAKAPRTPDGKPDLSGMWAVQRPGDRPGRPVYDITAFLAPGSQMSMKPEAEALFKKRQPFDSTLRTTEPKPNCLPMGPVLEAYDGGTELVQTRAFVVVMGSWNAKFRKIYIDGRGLPNDPDPSFDGYSAGHWDGDTLIVDTIGVNDRSWLDIGGHPISEAAKITERYTRRDFGHMTVQITVDDPTNYTKPWTIVINKILRPDTTELISYCLENEKDLSRIQKANEAGRNK